VAALSDRNDGQQGFQQPIHIGVYSRSSAAVPAVALAKEG